VAISQKCQYALRAVFELSRRYPGKPTSIPEIARAQAIPPRFLELILGQLRRGGLVESKRGVHGGYTLAGEPAQLSVGTVIRLVDGPFDPVNCGPVGGKSGCPLAANCAFLGLWARARKAVEEVYDKTTLQDLIDEFAACGGDEPPMYAI
jgi:Rrf2 family cysteine metabolism transcriptional repressor